WKGITKDIAEHLKTCVYCQKLKQLPTPRMRGTIAGTQPFQSVAIDLMGPLEEDADGMRYLMVFVDSFTRFVEIQECKSTTADEAVDILHSSIISRYGIPNELRTDAGGQFTSGKFKEMCKDLRINHVVVTVGHHEENGMVERIIGELRKIVRYIRLHSETPPVWRQVRMTMMSVLNARHHSSIGCSPFRALFGNNMLEGRGSLEELWTPCIGSEEEEEQQQLSSEYVTKLSELYRALNGKAALFVCITAPIRKIYESIGKCQLVNPAIPNPADDGLPVATEKVFLKKISDFYGKKSALDVLYELQRLKLRKADERSVSFFVQRLHQLLDTVDPEDPLNEDIIVKTLLDNILLSRFRTRLDVALQCEDKSLSDFTRVILEQCQIVSEAQEDAAGYGEAEPPRQSFE
ncbi:hypothetical protein ADUPG1_000412, partial [Aduncisulcus paluster]